MLSGLELRSYQHCCTDSPTPLRSSELGPVEASIEDLGFLPSESLQVDATPLSPGNAQLEHKLAQEFNYHKCGSYTQVEQPDLSPYSYSGSSLPPQPIPNHRWPGDPPQQVSSIQSWTKPEEPRQQSLGLSHLEGQNKPEYETQMSGQYTYDRHQRQQPQFDRMQSWPCLMSETAAQESNAGLHVSSPLICPQPETGTCTHTSGFLAGYLVQGFLY